MYGSRRIVIARAEERRAGTLGSKGDRFARVPLRGSMMFGGDLIPEGDRAAMNAKPRNKSKWTRRSLISAGLALAVFAGCPMGRAAQNAPEHGKLRIWFVDVEGGQSTLFVTPDKHSLLIDTGWPDNGGRDAERIAQAAKQ